MNEVARGREFHGMSSMAKYEELSKLGKGTFGEVVKARNRKDHKLVALKSIIVHNQKGGFPITALREVTIMKLLKNENVLQLLELVCKKDPDTKGIKKLPVFYMVMPYMSYDLAGLLTNPRVRLTQAHIKCLMQQLLRGIDYIHQQNYLHRDIKAANILIDHFGILKIADFGLARNYEGAPPVRGQGPCKSVRRYTGLVVTRWYRAPELLLGNQRYTTAVDIWGVGCVFGEMFEKSPILLGKSDLDQGRLIFELVGAPTLESWKEYKILPNANQFAFPASRRSLEQRFSNVGKVGLQLMDGLLKLDPEQRFNALDALDHSYFKTNPLPCHPSELPKMEDSHEIDADKFREELKNPVKHNGDAPRNGVPPRGPRQPMGDNRYPPNAYPGPPNGFGGRGRNSQPPKEPYRPDNRSRYNLPKDPYRLDVRPESRPNGRPDNRPDNRPDTRINNRSDTKPGNRPDNRSDNRPESWPESSRPENRPKPHDYRSRGPYREQDGYYPSRNQPNSFPDGGMRQNYNRDAYSAARATNYRSNNPYPPPKRPRHENDSNGPGKTFNEDLKNQDEDDMKIDYSDEPILGRVKTTAKVVGETKPASKSG